MKERMNKERAIEILKTIRHNSTMQTDYTIDDIDQALDIAIAQIQVNEQIRRERDIAIQQLNELGYEFGEKIRSAKNERLHKRV